VLSASFHEASAIMNSLSEMHEAMVALSDADISEKRQHVDRLLVRYERLRLAKSPNCTRSQCVHGVYTCPAKLGNGMQEFVSSHVLAVVSERPLIWTNRQYGVGLEPCNRFLSHSSWLRGLQHSKLDTATKQTTCAFAAVTHGNTVETHLACRGTQLAPACNAETRLVALQMSGDSTVRYSGQEMASLGLVAASSSATTDAGLAPEVAARARKLFAMGPHYAFGRSFASAFAFDARAVRQPTRIVLEAAAGRTLDDAHGYYYDAASKPALWIGVHMRHRDKNLNGT
jgi:hypothetical protein